MSMERVLETIRMLDEGSPDALSEISVCGIRFSELPEEARETLSGLFRDADVLRGMTEDFFGKIVSMATPRNGFKDVPHIVDRVERVVSGTAFRDYVGARAIDIVDPGDVIEFLMETIEEERSLETSDEEIEEEGSDEW